jgi:hypothetical protein
MGAIDKFDRSCIYQLTCPDCSEKYTGQDGRSFRKRYKEHLQSFKYRNSNLIFAKHLHITRHSLGPMERIMDTLHFVKAKKLTNSLETFYIYSEIKRNNQINEESTTGSNKFYDAQTQHESDRCPPWLRCTSPDTLISRVTPQFWPVNIAPPPPPFKHNTSSYHNTTILAEHKRYKYSHFVN